MPEDFRLVKPIRKYNSHTNEVEYQVPCRVVKIGGLLDHNKVSIEVEHLDFLTGEVVKSQGFTYMRTLDIFKDLQLKPPISTTCRILKVKKGSFKIKVFGVFNTDLVEQLYNVTEILNNDEKQIMNVFKSHYKALLFWLMEYPEKTKTDNDTDLPF